jgi:hypothetical protein
VPPLPMVLLMNDSSPTGRAIVNSLRSSLKLVCSSLELLTYSQLSALEYALRQTMPIISAQLTLERGSMLFQKPPECIMTYLLFSGNPNLVLDVDDWESASSKCKTEAPSGGKRLLLHSYTRITGSGGGNECCTLGYF